MPAPIRHLLRDWKGSPPPSAHEGKIPPTLLLWGRRLGIVLAGSEISKVGLLPKIRGGADVDAIRSMASGDMPTGAPFANGRASQAIECFAPTTLILACRETTPLAIRRATRCTSSAVVARRARGSGPTSGARLREAPRHVTTFAGH